MDQTVNAGVTGTNAGTRALNAVDDVAARAHGTIDRVSANAQPTIDRLADRAHGVVEKAAVATSDAADALGEQAAKLRQTQVRLTEQCRDYVQDNPMLSVGLAVATGFLLGKLLLS